MKIINNNIGFTLAEILVTLGIIGVIASITIPNLVQDVQDAQFKTAWKKAYAELSQATSRVLLDNSGSLKGVFTDSNSLKDKYFPYMNYVKSCNINDFNCWHGINTWKTLKGIPYTYGADGAIILNNGNLLILNYSSNQCDQAFGSIRRCGHIYIDINGFKQPNTMGKDIFKAHIMENSIKPYGTSGDSIDQNPASYGCSPGADGQGCSALYLYQ